MARIIILCGKLLYSQWKVRGCCFFVPVGGNPAVFVEHDLLKLEIFTFDHSHSFLRSTRLIKPVVLQNKLSWANKICYWLSYIVLSFFSFRTAVKAVVERLTQSAFYTSARALFERDRPLFSLLCALEVSKCWSCGFDRLLWHCGPTTDLLQYSIPCSSLNKFE